MKVWWVYKKTTERTLAFGGYECFEHDEDVMRQRIAGKIQDES
jgi:hypothetical protein